MIAGLLAIVSCPACTSDDIYTEVALEEKSNNAHPAIKEKIEEWNKVNAEVADNTPMSGNASGRKGVKTENRETTATIYYINGKRSDGRSMQKGISIINEKK